MGMLGLLACSSDVGHDAPLGKAQQHWYSVVFEQHDRMTETALMYAEYYGIVTHGIPDFFDDDKVKAWNRRTDDTMSYASFYTDLYGVRAHSQTHHLIRGNPEDVDVYLACIHAKHDIKAATRKALDALKLQNMEAFNGYVGTVAHTLQDSYAPAHTSRAPGCGDLVDLCTIHWDQPPHCKHHDGLLGSGDDADDNHMLANCAIDTTIGYLEDVIDAVVQDDPWLATDDPDSTINRVIKCNQFADSDGDGVPTHEPFFIEDSGEEYKGFLDCNDSSADIGGCNGNCTKDQDNDGIPDECDPCPLVVDQAFVAQNHTGAIAPVATDHNGNGVSDECELCPDKQKPEYGPFIDADGDGVHDKCDNCEPSGPHAHNPVRPCNAQTPCPDYAPNLCIPGSDVVHFGRCLDDPAASCAMCATPNGWEICPFSRVCSCQEAGAWGRCEHQGNKDSDIRGDACDVCPSYASKDYRNSNFYAEVQYPELKQLEDICEPVPVVRFSGQQTSHKIDIPDPTKSYGWLFESFNANAWIGYSEVDDGGQGPTAIQTVDDGRVWFRHCSCYGTGGQELAVGDCAGKQLQCAPTQMQYNASGKWYKPTIRYYKGLDTDNPVDAQGAPQTFRTLQEKATVAGDRPFEWTWREDADSGKIIARDPGTKGTETHGVLGTFVTSGGYTSSRDYYVGLRTAVSLYHTPMIMYVQPPPNVPGLELFPCELSGCHIFLDPRDYREIVINPDPRWSFPGPGLLRSEQEHPIFRSPQFNADLTGQVTAELQDVLNRADEYVWIKASEPRSVLADYGMDQRIVGLAADGKSAPIVLEQREDALDARRTDSGAAFPSGSRAAFSAMENAVYMVGGTIDGQPTEAILIYDLNAGTVDRVASAARLQPSPNVLAVAYDGVRSTLYVLDLDREGGARLIAYDLTHTDQATLLFEFAVKGRFSSTHLAVADDGRLILIGSGAEEHTAWLLNPRAEQPTFDGTLRRPGAVLDGPFQGLYAPVLPLLLDKALSFEELSTSSFEAGSPCEEL